MKSLRRIVFLICVMLIAMFGFTGCGDIEEGSSNRATISFNDEYITLYSPIESNVDIAITVSYSDNKSIDITKQISMNSGETKVFSAVDIDDTIFSEDSIITSATIVSQEYSATTIVGFWLFSTILISLCILFFIIKFG